MKLTVEILLLELITNVMKEITTSELLHPRNNNNLLLIQIIYLPNFLIQN